MGGSTRDSATGASLSAPASEAGFGSFKEGRTPGATQDPELGLCPNKALTFRWKSGKLVCGDNRVVEAEPGTRAESTPEWSAENHLKVVVERKEDGTYLWDVRTLDGAMGCKGSYKPAGGGSTEGRVSELCVDLQSTKLDARARDALLRALERAEKDLPQADKPPRTPPPSVPSPPSAPPGTAGPAATTSPASLRILHIVKDDWLTRISKKTWSTLAWENHLKPTPDTLANRQSRRKAFDPDLIYPGDTFYIIRE